jgi:hypothetical protein
MSTEKPFLVDVANAPFLSGEGLAIPQHFGDGGFNLVIGVVVGWASLLVLPIILLLRVQLDAVSLLLIAASSLGALWFAWGQLWSGWRSIQSARAYRTRARLLAATFVSVELVDEGSGDWFLRGTYEFADDDGVTRGGEFSQYRPDLVGKSLPAAGSRAAVLYIDPEHHTIL